MRRATRVAVGVAGASALTFGAASPAVADGGDVVRRSRQDQFELFLNGRYVTCDIRSYFIWDKSAHTLEAGTESSGTAPECSGDGVNPWVSASYVDDSGNRRSEPLDDWYAALPKRYTHVASGVSTRHGVYYSPLGADQYSPIYRLPK
jgi:hypothetical protein